MSTVSVDTSIASLADPPVDAYDAYLRLHLLSHRLIRPHDANLDGLFGVLSNVAWTSHGPVDPAALPQVQRRFRAAGEPFQVFSVDKFPRMTDYVVPSGRADRRRRPRAPRRPPGRRHDGHARGLRELQRRHARALDGRGAHQRRRGGRRRLRRRRRRLDHGHAVGRRHGGHLDRRALPAGRQLRARDLARRRLRGRGRALPDGGRAGDAARRRRGQGARAERRERAAVPAQLAVGRDRGRAAQRRRGAGLNAALHANQ